MGWYPPSAKERFISKIDFTSSPIGCWIWKGSHGGFATEGKHAYGRFWFMEKNVMAHRFSYEFIGGYEIEKDNVIDHLCKNPNCVNPNHLESITVYENSIRTSSGFGKNARKTECIRGHPLSGENLYEAKNRTRKCKTCIKLRTQNFRKTGSYTLPLVED